MILKFPEYNCDPSKIDFMIEKTINLDKSDCPSEISHDGLKFWYNIVGERHRLDGPAVIWPNGYQAYWVNGLRHRLDGPAVIYPSGKVEYWENGEFIK